MKYKTADLTRALVLVLSGVKDKKQLSSSMDKFFSYLKDIKATSLMPKILGLFSTEWDKAHKTEPVRVWSARPLGSAVRKEIISAIGEERELIETVDAALLGGIKIMVGDTLVDATLKKRVENLTLKLRNS